MYYSLKIHHYNTNTQFTIMIKNVSIKVCLKNYLKISTDLIKKKISQFIVLYLLEEKIYIL